jgi:repressor LexA
MSEAAPAKRPRALTQRQRDILQCIVAFMDQHGHAPSLRQIQEGTGISSVSVVSHHLAVVEAHGGYIRRTPGIPRSIVLLPAAYRMCR